MKLLDLFAGTGSIGNVGREMGWDVISLDRDMEADIEWDIMDWDYKVYPKNILMLSGHLLHVLNIVLLKQLHQEILKVLIKLFKEH